MKYFFGFLASIGLIIFVIVLIVRGFTGGGDKNTKLPTPLSDYAHTSVQMQYIMDGPTVADQERRSLRITVGQDESSAEVLEGYNQNVIASKSYVSNDAAYGEFLRALDIAGYTKGANEESSQKNTDERGFCPSGYRYSFDIIDGSSRKQHLWATSCGAKQGTFKGKTSAVRTLFEDQIPDYGKGELKL
jgi:hypothetical protein